MGLIQTLRRTFHLGRMNIDADERLLPQGEYREATNILVVNQEGTDVGAVRKSYSNKRLTNLSLGANPVTLGEFAYDRRDRIYWLVKSDTGCFLIEYDNNTQSTTYVLHDTRSAGTRVFSLSEDHLCTAIAIVTSDDEDKELMLLTDDNMPPLCFNISRAKGYGENGFELEDILLIKKPPRFAPSAQLTYAGGLENDMEEAFFSFAYRYKYLDGEYSALSDYTPYRFAPGAFRLDYQTGENLSMVNQFNAVRIGFDTGDKRVTDIQLVFKKSNSNNLYIIETFNKEKEGWDNSVFQFFTFTNNKLYQVLPEKELYRLFDNVPLKAKAMAILGNRPFFGNYTEGYNMLDVNGNKIKPEYTVSIISNDLSGVIIPVSLPAPGDEDGDTIFRFNLADINLIQGGRLTLLIEMQAENDGVLSGNYISAFEYILLQDYANAGELAQDEGFINFVTNIMTESFINGYTLTPPADSTLTETTDFTIAYTTDTIDIIAPQQTWTIDNTPGDTEDSDFTDEIYQWKFFDAAASFKEFGVASSVKTNRSYEIGLVYEDTFNRCSTVQTGKNNTVYVPQTLSTSQNKLKITLDSLPPTWADRFKVVVKAAPLTYQNIYIVTLYKDGPYYWLKLDGANKDKVDEGEMLIIKSDAAGPRYDIQKILVLEKKTQETDFIPENASDSGALIIEEGGTYIKVKADNINMDSDGDNFFNYSKFTLATNSPATIGPSDTSGNGVGTLVGYYDEDTTAYVDLPITPGSIIKIGYIYYSSISGIEDILASFEYTAQAQYDNFENWYEAEASDLGQYNDNFTVTFTRNGDNSLYMNVAAAEMTMTQIGVVLTVQRSAAVLILETEPKTADLDIYYETGQAFEIVDGYHTGNLQDQTDTLPAEIELDFFNCFTMGNGAECYQVKDSIRKNFLNIDLRPSTTSIEEYKQIRRNADITYGGPYIESASINALNEFNLATVNYKDDIDKQYGSIQKLYARENDLVVLQEEKAGKVLYDKNAIYTANGDSAITSVPGILGQYIPYQGNRGIGTHPESFSVDPDGRIKYWSARTGTVIRLSVDGIEDIIYGMRNFFRGLSIAQPNAKVISGYDPFLDHTVFSFGEEPESLPEFNCGSVINKYRQEGEFSYEFILNNLGGDIVIAYNITEDNATIEAEFNGTTTVVSNVTGSGTIVIERDSLVENRVTVTVTPVNNYVSYTLTNTCPIGTELTIVSLVLNDSEDTDTTMTDRYKWGGTSYFSYDELFGDGPVTRFTTQTGIEGVGAFPSNGSLVTIQAFKDTINSGNFTTTECNRLGYLITSTVYTSADYLTIINNPDTEYLTLTTSGEEGFTTTNTGSFLFERTTDDQILYLIWDYTSRNPVIENDTANCNLGEDVIIDVLANDSVSVDAVVTVATQPTYGTAVANVDGTITYTHDGSENYADSFTYTVTDGGCSSTATVTLTIGITCGDTLTANGASGIYELTLNFGTDTGYCGILFNAQSVPDRFQLIWDGNTVADSKYIGDGIIPGPPTSYADLLGEHTLSVYEYTGGEFVDTGVDETFTVIQSDIADNVTEPTNGNGFLIFNKTTALPATVTLRAIGPVTSTAWTLNSVICPGEELADATEMLVYGPFTEANKGNSNTSIKVYKDNTLDQFYTNELGYTNFIIYGVTATVAYINDGTNWWQISNTGAILSTGTLP